MSAAPALTSLGEEMTLERIRYVVLSTKKVRSDNPAFDDIVQEVAIRIWKRPDMNPATLAHSVIIDHLRRHGPIARNGKPRITGNTLSLDGPAQHSDTVTIGDTIRSHDMPIEEMDFDNDGMKKLLDRLTAAEKRMVLAFANGVPLKKIGSEHHISESRVSQIIERARKRLIGELPAAQRSPLRAREIGLNNGYTWDTPYRRKTELLMLQKLADGLTQKQIAVETRYTQRTVGKYVQTAARRMGAATAEQAVAEALRRGLIE